MRPGERERGGEKRRMGLHIIKGFSQVAILAPISFNAASIVFILRICGNLNMMLPLALGTMAEIQSGKSQIMFVRVLKPTGGKEKTTMDMVSADSETRGGTGGIKRRCEGVNAEKGCWKDVSVCVSRDDEGPFTSKHSSPFLSQSMLAGLGLTSQNKSTHTAD